MKKNIFFALFSAMLLMTACQQHEIDSPADLGDGFTLVGHSDAQTKTAFGTPDENTIPFLWSEGDKIWSNGAQSDLASVSNDGATALFSFTSGSMADQVYYNMTGASATGAHVKSEQTIGNLGANGDFGYATVSEGSFILNHATAYLWFNVTSDVANATLESVKVNAYGANIAGNATWDGDSFEDLTEASNSVTLTVGETLSSTNGNVWAMVIFPSDLTGARVTYKLNVGGQTKYFYQELNAGKNLAKGQTARISANITSEELKDYELRVLTFEDEGSSTYWSDLIPAEDEQAFGVSSMIYGEGGSGLSEPYKWSDPFTKLSHSFPYNYSTYSFAGGGYVISTHQGTMSDLQNATDIYNYQLSIPLATGHNGSDNFCIGYHDSNVNLEDDVKPALVFSDGQARVIDHMYVTNASVTMYCISFGNSFSSAYGEGDYLDIVATGYNGETKGETIKFRLAAGAGNKVDAWTRWDLSSLGAVTKVVFSMDEAQKDDWGYGVFYKTPMYFTYDDVAVRFPIE